MSGYVYLARAGDLYKIGSSANPAKRVKSITRAFGPPELVHTIESDDPAWLERLLQSRFLATRADGEWFRLTTEDVVLTVGLCRLDRLATKPAWLEDVDPAVFNRAIVAPLSDTRFSATKIREGFRQLATQVSADAYPELEALAVRNGRSVVDELAHAIRRHLAVPPTVRVVVDEVPLPPAEVVPVAKAKRGRKAKAAVNGQPQES